MEFRIQILFLLVSSFLQLYPCQTCQKTTITEYNCSNLLLTDIPSEKLNHIYKLDLSFNAITTLKNDSFLDRGLENIGVLLLQVNKITSIEVNAFRGMEDLFFINLSNNDIVDLPEDLFQWNIKLRILRFENNTRLQLPQIGFNLPALLILDLELCGLKTIPNNFFDNMTDLEILYLRQNKLSHLDSNLFRHLHELELLDLRDNLFTKLSLDILRLPLIFKLSFVGNPLSCDCSLLRAYSLYKKRAIFESLLCTRDDNKTKIELYNLALQLNCNPSTTTILPSSTPNESTPDVQSQQAGSFTADDLDIANGSQRNNQDDRVKELVHITGTQLGVIVLCVIILLTLVIASFFIVKNRRKQFLITNTFKVLEESEANLSTI